MCCRTTDFNYYKELQYTTQLDKYCDYPSTILYCSVRTKKFKKLFSFAQVRESILVPSHHSLLSPRFVSDPLFPVLPSFLPFPWKAMSLPANYLLPPLTPPLSMSPVCRLTFCFLICRFTSAIYRLQAPSYTTQGPGRTGGGGVRKVRMVRVGEMLVVRDKKIRKVGERLGVGDEM